jgi:hypothetical protein
MADLLTDLLRSSVTQLEVHTVDGPDIVITDPFGPDAGGLPELAKQRPQLILLGTNGLQVANVAPWGNPGPSHWPTYVAWFKWGVIGLGAFALYKALK